MSFKIKELGLNYIKEELKNINFDLSYLEKASKKYSFKLIKIYSLTAIQANILKQIALSVGADCAVHHDVITHKIDFSDAILGATSRQLKQIISKLEKQPFSLKLLSENLSKKLSQDINFTFKKQNLNMKKTNLMGILNLTPDSFSDGGKYCNIDKAIEHAFELSKYSDIVDLGGESTRPGTSAIDVEEEIRRVIPVLKELKKMDFDLPISIDTRNAQTAETAIEYGCDIINDVSGGNHDPRMLEVIAESDVGYVLMHSIGTPENMQKFANYKNVADDVYLNLAEKLQKAQEKGISKNRIILDIGLGFPKQKKHNLELLRKIKEFKSLGCGLLVGASRKNFLGGEDLRTKDEITLGLSSYLVNSEINILRVHNPRLHYAPLRLLDEIQYTNQEQSE